MEPTSWERIQELFEVARSMPPESRSEYLRGQCSGEPSLQRDVEELLEEADSSAGVQDVSLSDLDRDDSSSGLAVGTALGDYRVVRELGRGGMGVVYEATQISLNREVALKLVDAREEPENRGGYRPFGAGLATPGDPELLERFVEEAQIGGQLQHPGIVPVYEMGLLTDGRRYFTMKLVKGRTLAAMLSDRRSVDEDRARFLNIFEAACQAIAYAHSNSVLHRDLKPSNIMVGAFGEVQVVDWGLSKVLSNRTRTRRRGLPTDDHEKVETADRRPESLNSRAGNVLGTPAYMSPEQARGEVDQIDKRTDVFGLGAILCEILTGGPPHAAKGSGAHVLQQAARSEVGDAHARIENSIAAPNLKQLCIMALAADRNERPRDAGQLARAIHDHLSNLEQRAHQDRLNAERSRRQTQLSLLGGLFLLLAVVGGGTGWWMVQNESRKRHKDVLETLDAVGVDVLRHERAGDLERALESARSGVLLTQSADAGPDLRQKASELFSSTEERWLAEQERIALVDRERQFLAVVEQLSDRFLLPADSSRWNEINAEYDEAFRSIGVELDSGKVEDVLSAYWATPLGIKLALVFDDWARLLRSTRNANRRAGRLTDYDRDHDIELLTGIGLALDPDPTRASIREALLAGNTAELMELARQAEIVNSSPDTLILLTGALREFGESNLDLRLTMLAANHYPSSFPLLFAAGNLNIEIPGGLRKAESYLRAAVAIRPDLPIVHGRLALALSRSGDSVGAINVVERAMDLSSDRSWDSEDIAINCLHAGQFEKGLRHLAGNPDSEPVALLTGFLRVMLGELEREEYIDWFESLPAGDPTIGATPALLLTAFVPPGLDPQPERALDLFELAPGARTAMPNYWISTSAAHILLGHGAEGIEAAIRLEQSARGQRYHLCIAYLLQAAGHAIQGDARRAGVLFKRAQRTRAELFRAHSQQWAGGFIDMAFERFEPVALKR